MSIYLGLQELLIPLFCRKTVSQETGISVFPLCSQVGSRNRSCVFCTVGNFPPPTTPEELGARILIQERYEKFGESEEVEMEVESDEEDEKQEKTDEPSTQLDQDTQVQDMDEVGSQQKWHYSCPVRFVWDLLWSSS